MAKLIPYDKVKEIIEAETDWVRAALAIQYASGCRVGELIEYEKRNKQQTTHGIKRSDFVITPEQISWKLPNFKTKSRPQKKAFLRIRERWLYTIIDQWLKVCAEIVFPLRISWHSENINRVLHRYGYTSHDLRHSRATHLLEETDYTPYDLKEMLGHSSIITGQTYVHTLRMKEKLDKGFTRFDYLLKTEKDLIDLL